MVGNKDAGGEVARDAGGDVDDGHPQGAGQLLHVSHYEDLEAQGDHQVEQPAARLHITINNSMATHHH